MSARSLQKSLVHVRVLIPRVTVDKHTWKTKNEGERIVSLSFWVFSGQVAPFTRKSDRSAAISKDMQLVRLPEIFFCCFCPAFRVLSTSRDLKGG